MDADEAFTMFLDSDCRYFQTVDTGSLRAVQHSVSVCRQRKPAESIITLLLLIGAASIAILCGCGRGGELPAIQADSRASADQSRAPQRVAEPADEERAYNRAEAEVIRLHRSFSPENFSGRFNSDILVNATTSKVFLKYRVATGAFMRFECTIDPKKSPYCEDKTTLQDRKMIARANVLEFELREKKKHAWDAKTVVWLYENNEINADNTLKGRSILIKGRVERIAKDIVGEPYIILQGRQDGIATLQCTFAAIEAPALAQLTRGQVVYLEGTVLGKIGNILIHENKLVP